METSFRPHDELMVTSHQVSKSTIPQDMGQPDGKFQVDIIDDDGDSPERRIPYKHLDELINPIEFIDALDYKEYGAISISVDLPVPKIQDVAIRLNSYHIPTVYRKLSLSNSNKLCNNLAKDQQPVAETPCEDDEYATVTTNNHKRFKLSVPEKLSKGILLKTGDFHITSNLPVDNQINYCLRNLINTKFDDFGETVKVSELYRRDITNGKISQLENTYWSNFNLPTTPPILYRSLLTSPTEHDSNDEINPLHPWSLLNIPILPGSLNFLQDSYKFNIGRINDTQNWSIVDNWGQSIKYQIVGFKKWYIIPESEYDKFWSLINLSHIEKFEIDTNDIRLKNSNGQFQNLIPDVKYFEPKITPKILNDHNIKYSTTIQKPGSYLITYPKTIMFGISLSFNIEQEVSLLTPLWIDYAKELINNNRENNNGEIFKIVISSIQQGNENLSELYDLLYTKELELRSKIRELGIKETIQDNGLHISDDNLELLYPTKISITDTQNSTKFEMSIVNFLKMDTTSLQAQKLKIEMISIISDDKLKTIYKNSINLNDYNKWITNYEKIMQSSDHSLKIYKNVFNEGDKIFNSLTATNHFDHFQDLLGVKSSKNDKNWTKFINYLNNLKTFINSSSSFIDECQSILSLKHQQRIRGSNLSSGNIMNGFNDIKQDDDDDELSDPDVVLPKLSQLVSKIPKLNFSCTEIDMILEFMNEIENFERSVRLLILKNNPTMREFNDLINLGKSFGINLKSLKFLIRIRNKLIWNKNFELIINGNEPINQENKKILFDLINLKFFYNQGIEILGSSDVDKLMTVEKIIKNSENFNAKIDDFLKINVINDESIIKLLDNLIDEIDDRYKLENDDRILVNISKFDKLLDLSQILENFEKFFKFKNSNNKLNYDELLKLKDILVNTKLISSDDIKFIDSLVDVTNSKVSSITNYLTPTIEPELESVTDATSTNESITGKGSKLDSKDRNNLVSLIDDMLYTITSLTLEDTYIKSSSCLTINNKEIDDPHQIYCICRNYELGSMIECDNCKEWYHDLCINNGGKKKDLFEEIKPDLTVKKVRKRKKKVDAEDDNDKKKSKKDDRKRDDKDEPIKEKVNNVKQSKKADIKEVKEIKVNDAVNELKNSEVLIKKEDDMQVDNGSNGHNVSGVESGPADTNVLTNGNYQGGVEKINGEAMPFEGLKQEGSADIKGPKEASNKTLKPRKPRDKKDKKSKNDKEKIEEEETSFICPICTLISSSSLIDSKLSSSPTLLHLTYLIEELKKLKVQPIQELNKLVELHDKLIIYSQAFFKQIFDIKSGDYNIWEKIDRLRFILRKVYGCGINIEDIIWECITSINRLEFEKLMIEREKSSRKVKRTYPREGVKIQNQIQQNTQQKTYENQGQTSNLLDSQARDPVLSNADIGEDQDQIQDQIQNQIQFIRDQIRVHNQQDSNYSQEVKDQELQEFSKQKDMDDLIDNELLNLSKQQLLDESLPPESNNNFGEINAHEDSGSDQFLNNTEPNHNQIISKLNYDTENLSDKKLNNENESKSINELIEHKAIPLNPPTNGPIDASTKDSEMITSSFVQPPVNPERYEFKEPSNQLPISPIKEFNNIESNSIETESNNTESNNIELNGSKSKLPKSIGVSTVECVSPDVSTKLSGMGTSNQKIEESVLNNFPDNADEIKADSLPPAKASRSNNLIEKVVDSTTNPEEVPVIESIINEEKQFAGEEISKDDKLEGESERTNNIVNHD